MNTCTINKISPYGMQSAVMINQCSNDDIWCNNSNGKEFNTNKWKRELKRVHGKYEIFLLKAAKLSLGDR